MTLPIDPGMEKRVAKLEQDRDVMAWLYAEMLHINKEATIKLKTLMLQRALSDPAVQKQVAEQMVRHGNA